MICLKAGRCQGQLLQRDQEVITERLQTSFGSKDCFSGSQLWEQELSWQLVKDPQKVYTPTFYSEPA